LKIADFGLSRKFRDEGKYTNKMVTLWYRAPELLLGVTDYDCSVDVWSVGYVELFIFYFSPIY
jgi:serine/threonine protein kinase